MAQNQQQTKTDRHAQALIVNPVRLPYPQEAAQYNVDDAQWRALVDAVWPGAQTVDGILLALSWCRWRKLDPIKRPCHIVAIWNSRLGRNVESVWPSIAEVRITAFRTGQYAGIDQAEWGPMISKTFTGAPRATRDGSTVRDRKEVSLNFPEWCRHTVYRIVQGQRFAFVGPKVYYLAAYGSVQDTELPNEKWQEPGYYMLEKCSEAAALRRAFPEEMGDMVTAEEMEGRRFETQTDMGGGMTVESPARPQKTDPRFAEQKTTAKDVDSEGKVEDKNAEPPKPQAAKPTAQPASNAEARRATARPQAEPKSPEPKQEPAEDQGERGEEATDVFEIFDQVGEVTELFTLADYVDNITRMMEAAKSESELVKLYDYNINTINQQDEDVKRPIFRTYSSRVEQLRSDAAKAKQSQAPQGQEQQRFSLFDHVGEPYQRNLITSDFVNGLEALFKKAVDQPRLEAIYRYNAKTIQMLPQLTQNTIVNLYHEQVKAISSGQPRPLI